MQKNGCEKTYTEFFRNNTFTFTGKLHLIERAEAMGLVEVCGGAYSKNVTRKTSVLVVGTFQNEICMRNKYRLASRYIEQGCKIQIISEELFYKLLLKRFAVVIPKVTGETERKFGG